MPIERSIKDSCVQATASLKQAYEADQVSNVLEKLTDALEEINNAISTCAAQLKNEYNI